MSNSVEIKEAAPHYKLAGKSLIGLGSINIIIALYFILQSNALGFIDSKMMIAFGTLFVVTGCWMISTSESIQNSSHTL